MVAIVGEAGLGKSRLVSRLRTHEASPAKEPAFLWLVGRCLEFSTAATYWPGIAMIHQHFDWTAEADEKTRAGLIVSCLRQMASQGRISASQLDEMAPILGNLLSCRLGGSWADILRNADAKQVQNRAAVVLREFPLALEHIARGIRDYVASSPRTASMGMGGVTSSPLPCTLTLLAQGRISS